MLRCLPAQQEAHVHKVVGDARVVVGVLDTLECVSALSGPRRSAQLRPRFGDGPPFARHDERQPQQPARDLRGGEELNAQAQLQHAVLQK